MRRRGSRRAREAPPSMRRLPTLPLEEAPPVGPAGVPSPSVVLNSMEGRRASEGAACGLSPLTTPIPLPVSTAKGNNVVPSTAEERSAASPHDDGAEMTKKDKAHVEGEEEYEALCGICFTQVDNAMNPRGILNHCQHFFCAYCIQEWGKHTNMCPSCKVRFTRIEIPAGPSREMKIIKVRRKNYSNWETNEDSEEESGEVGEALSTLCCSVCDQSENPTQMIFCDRRDCTFIAHLECLHLIARPLTFLCGSCQEELAPSLAMEPTEETKKEKKGSEEGTAASSSAPPPPARITGKKIPMTHLPPSVAQRLRTIHVAGEPVLALMSPSPVSSSSRPGRRRSRSTSPSTLRGSASPSLSPHASPPVEIPANDPSAMTGHERTKKKREVAVGSGPAVPPIPPFSSLPFTPSGTRHPEREGPPRRGEEVEEDPLYFLSPSPHTMEARGAFRSWKSDHPEVSFPASSSWTAARAMLDTERAPSSVFASDPSFTRVSPWTPMTVPKHVPAGFEQSLQRLSSSSSFSPRGKRNTTMEADEADDSYAPPFSGRRRPSVTSNSSNTPMHSRSPFSPTSSSSSSLSEGSRGTAARPDTDALENPQRRAALIERLTRERAADMISVVRQRRYIERHQTITVDRSGGGGGTHAVGSPHSAAEEEAEAWREAMNACRPQVEQQLRRDMAQLRAKKERKLRVEAQREALALDKLARLIASHHEAERRRREGQISSTPVPTSSLSSNETCVVVVNVEEDSL